MMDRKDADAVARLLKWTIATLKELESDLLAHKLAMLNYPTIVKAALSQGVRFDVEEQGRLLQVAVEAARHSPRLVEAMKQKYDAFLASIQERPVALDVLESALKDFETWKPTGSVN